MEIAAASRSFESLNLTAETLASLDAKGYRQPTDVQAETIPRAQAGKDLVVQSRTGTGKTAAFGIPIIVISLALLVASIFVREAFLYAVALFVFGWTLQFVGHIFEGKRPEFFNDWRFLFVGLRWWWAKVRGRA